MSDQIKADIATWSDETLKETAASLADTLKCMNKIANACVVDELVTRFQQQQAEIERLRGLVREAEPIIRLFTQPREDAESALEVQCRDWLVAAKDVTQ